MNRYSYCCIVDRTFNIGYWLLVTDMVMIGIHVIMNAGIHMVLLLTRFAKLCLMWVC
jgi:hypothetical protein